MNDSAAEVFAWRTRSTGVDVYKPDCLVERRAAVAIIASVSVLRGRESHAVSPPWKADR